MSAVDVYITTAVWTHHKRISEDNEKDFPFPLPTFPSFGSKQRPSSHIQVTNYLHPNVPIFTQSLLATARRLGPLQTISYLLHAIPIFMNFAFKDSKPRELHEMALLAAGPKINANLKRCLLVIKEDFQLSEVGNADFYVV